ncbi:hydrolase, NUDIX family [Necator americanus]|uniref:Hydrolase, NUDIX family n=1 Tax=Necator americanus TaxID=51031 RepID=W2TC79_NECAM|nr:hydrolase, NUDIX family [Necator americanus]ETN78617.1 hydrolase, NUDIX family [Necator americanus]
MVQEVANHRDGNIFYSTHHGWKFPSGKAHVREPIFQAANRKVFEETGINAEPKAVIAVRHKVATFTSGNGTLFFFCLMYANDEQVKEIREKPPKEFFDLWWFSRDELRTLNPSQFFLHHREVFEVYDRWLESNGDSDLYYTMNNKSHISHMCLFSSV